MSSTFRIDFVEAALLALLIANLPAAYGAAAGTGTAAINVAPLGDADFDADGQLILTPPAVRVRFLGADYNTLHDNQRLTYQSAPQFEILCFESSLASLADERRQTLILVSAVLDQLAGSRLNLSDGSKTQPTTIVDVRLVEGAASGVDQLFSVRIGIEGFAQFSGVNANGN